jgi:uncharacterized membrane protein
MVFSECIKKTLAFLKTLFLSGLFMILPIAFTLFFVNFAYNFIYRILAPLRSVAPLFLKQIPGIEFFIATGMILLIGVILRVVIAHSIVYYFEELIARIPLIRIIYSSAKILVNFFKVQKSVPSSKKVVLIQYPRERNFHIAFLLESAQNSYQEIIPDRFKKHPDEEYVKVFMPNSPNPTTGYFFILPKAEIVETEITFEEAIKATVSCGLITPESIKHMKL